MLEYKSDKFIKDDLSLGIFLDRQSEAIGVHTHDFVEIVYVVSGDATEKINDVSYHQEEGRAGKHRDPRGGADLPCRKPALEHPSARGCYQEAGGSELPFGSGDHHGDHRGLYNGAAR